MSNKWKLLVALAILFAGSLACASEAQPEALPTLVQAGEPRPYRLGFTPFPYDISNEAVEYVYQHLAVDADIVAHHFDNGVPWPEALAGDDFHRNLQNEWDFRKDNTPDGHQIYVAITPLSWDRDSLAGYRGERGDMALPPPWDGFSFDAPEVKAAYLNYAIAVIEQFEPDYLAIGIESNLLAAKQPDLWPSYLELHRETYEQLKARYPDLPIFASLLGTALLEGYQAEVDHAMQMQAFSEIMPYSDYFGISIYPYLTKYLANEVPESMWQDLFALSDKAIAITETGYAAESFSIGDGSVVIDGSPQKQAAYIERLLQEAEARNFVFVINFVLRDYDLLIEQVEDLERDIAIAWKDSGLYTGDGEPRPALEIWREALRRPVQ